MIRTLGRLFSRFASRWVPDPFTIALLLTLITLGLCALTTGATPVDLVGNWGGRVDDGALLAGNKGFFKLLTFGMQMCLILVTGHALASSQPVQRIILRLASAPKSAAQAVVLTALTAMLCAFVNWGLGLIVGALTAREVALSARRRGIRLHYPIVGAAGYTGLMVWHGGLSGSAPLKVTQKGEMVRILGEGIDPIPLGATLFSDLNMVVSAALLLFVPLLLVMMLPKGDEDIVEINPDAHPSAAMDTPDALGDTTPAERLDRSRLLTLLLSAMALLYLWEYVSLLGIDKVGLNAINLLFLALGLLLHGSPRAYATAVTDATRGCSGIILQFPFYAGIMGMMALSGVVETFAQWISETVSTGSFSTLTFLSAGAVNLFVPSGGGQWAVQGPVVVEAAQNLGVPVGKAIMAFSYGDQWTNMLQPFWALPLLAITGLKAREIIGYTATLMFLSAPIFIICLMLL